MANHKLEELKKLPHFFVRDKFQQGDMVYLEGEFRPRLDPSTTSGDLIVVKSGCIEGAAMFCILWSNPDETSAVLEYYVGWDADEIAVGRSVPCSHWDLRQVLLILDLDTKWEARSFHSSDAWSYRSSPGWRATLEPGMPPPEDAEDIKKIKKGWDHEHCAFCWAVISDTEYGQPVGYVATNEGDREEWVCKECYETKIVPHKL